MSASPPVAYLLPGQGAQHRRMAAGLYGRLPAFTYAMDAVFEALGADGVAVRDDWLAETPRVDIDHVTRSQILLFAVDHAVGAQLAAWGIRPAAMLGHSVGEIAASVLAGILTLTDAVTLMWDRITRLAAAPAGRMLAVAATETQIAPFLTDEVVIGALNAPRQVVLSGPRPNVDSVARALDEAGYTTFPVASETAFHSPMLASAAREAVPTIARLTRRAPLVPIQSCYTAAPLTPSDVADPGYWAAHPVAPVRFWPALDALLTEGTYRLVEVGPRQGLSTIARSHPAVRSGRSSVVATLPARGGGDASDLEAFERMAAALLDAAPS